MNTAEAIIRNFQRNPDSLAVVDSTVRLTWREVYDRVVRLAGALAANGVSVGDRVVLLLDNSARNIEATYAVQWLGASVVPLNTRWTTQEIGFALHDCGPVAAFVDSANQATLIGTYSEANNLPRPVTIWADDAECPQGLIDYELLLSNAASAPRQETPSSAIASMFYTGGTTGRSKGVPLSHANQISHSIALIAECGLTSGMRYLHAAPMFHIADSLFTHVVTLLGGSHVILPKFSTASVAELVCRENIDLTILVPTMIQMLMADKFTADRAFGSLRRLFYGAAPMPESLLKALIGRYPELKLFQLYGQTEASPVLTVLPPEWHGTDSSRASKSRSAGRPLMGTEVRIVDGDDREVAPGVIGEIVARGPSVMSGYWQRPEETAAVLKGGWLHTGDAGYADKDGFIFVVDRIKDMIITGGENVYSVEVEQVIYGLEGVGQCCVVGLPHEKWGESVHAVVVPVAGAKLTQEQVKAHCAKFLADYKCPRSVSFRDEPFPVSGAGKILKRELRNEIRKSSPLSMTLNGGVE